VTGDGPSGNIAAQGFRILDKGDTIIFTGKSYLLLKGAKPTAPQAAPPTLPSEIEAAAARIEAAAVASPVANGSSIQDGPIVEPVRRVPPERVSPAEARRR
jgi:hypothetical protein